MATAEKLLLSQFTCFRTYNKNSCWQKDIQLGNQNFVLHTHIGMPNSSSRYCIVEQHKAGNTLKL